MSRHTRLQHDCRSPVRRRKTLRARRYRSVRQEYAAQPDVTGLTVTLPGPVRYSAIVGGRFGSQPWHRRYRRDTFTSLHRRDQQ